MDQKLEGRSFEPGDIVQVKGHGRAMVVADGDKFADRWWDDLSDAVVCEWMEDGTKRDAVHIAGQLEIVGSQRRRSDAELYDEVTTIAVATITVLAGDHQRDMARGALRMWSDLTGPLARDEDRLRLQQLVDRA